MDVLVAARPWPCLETSWTRTVQIGLLLAAVLLAGPALAEDYGSFPAPDFSAPFPASARTSAFAVVPPYGAFPLRTYATPTQGPFYNVPPYRVVAPY